MKKLILGAIAIFALSGAHAGPGDDIWNTIADLAKSISDLQGKVSRLETIVNTPAPVKHKISDDYHGGVIFWLDNTGEHGLIASKIDLNNGVGMQWRNGEAGYRNTNARADGIGAGENNTKLIIASQTMDSPRGKFAALVAANFLIAEDGKTPCKAPFADNQTCYGGWYLPSAYELKLLHANLNRKGFKNFAPEFYWSSTESSVSKAWLQNFATGELFEANKSDTLGRIRAVSRF